MEKKRWEDIDSRTENGHNKRRIGYKIVNECQWNGLNCLPNWSSAPSLIWLPQWARKMAKHELGPFISIHLIFVWHYLMAELLIPWMYFFFVQHWHAASHTFFPIFWNLLPWGQFFCSSDRARFTLIKWN